MRLLFQFLYGSIKAANVLRSSLPAAIFQFLYGSIKARNAYNDILYQVYNFNSSMVRLKPASVIVTISPIPRFQFLYGSIKALTLSRGRSNFKLFQFLYGSIKAWIWEAEVERSGQISIPLWFD